MFQSVKVIMRGHVIGKFEDSKKKICICMENTPNESKSQD